MSRTACAILEEYNASSKYKRRNRRGEAARRFRRWTADTMITTFASMFLTLASGVAMRHWRRGFDLEPLLDAISREKACAHRETETCALRFSVKESERFDLHPAEHPLLGFIWRQVVSKSLTEMREVLSGGHVVIGDPDASSYTFLHNLPGAVRRESSTHISDRAQYDIPEGRVVMSLLIGYLDGATWFQLEGAPWDLKHNFWRSLGHVCDTSEYFLSLMTRNVGPLGTSRYTDRRPLRKDGVMGIPEACPTACPSPAVTTWSLDGSEQERLVSNDMLLRLQVGERRVDGVDLHTGAPVPLLDTRSGLRGRGGHARSASREHEANQRRNLFHT